MVGVFCLLLHFLGDDFYGTDMFQKSQLLSHNDFSDKFQYAEVAFP